MATLIDRLTGLLYQVKRPGSETRKYSVNFSKLLASIGSVTSVIPQARGLVTETTALTISEITSTGTMLYFRASGGTDNEDYEVQMTVVDASGNTIVEDIMLKVRKAGLV